MHQQLLTQHGSVPSIAETAEKLRTYAGTEDGRILKVSTRVTSILNWYYIAPHFIFLRFLRDRYGRSQPAPVDLNLPRWLAGT